MQDINCENHCEDELLQSQQFKENTNLIHKTEQYFNDDNADEQYSNDNYENQSVNLNQNHILLSDYLKNDNLEEEIKKLQILANSENHRSSRTGQRKKRLKQQNQQNKQISAIDNISQKIQSEHLIQKDQSLELQQDKGQEKNYCDNNDKQLLKLKKQNQMSEQLIWNTEPDNQNRIQDNIMKNEENKSFQNEINLENQVQYFTQRDKKKENNNESDINIQSVDKHKIDLKVMQSERQQVNCDKLSQSQLKRQQKTFSASQNEQTVILNQKYKKNEEILFLDKNLAENQDITRINLEDSDEQKEMQMELLDVQHKEYNNQQSQLNISQNNSSICKCPIDSETENNTEQEFNSNFNFKRKSQFRKKSIKNFVSKIQNDKDQQSKTESQNNSSNIWDENNYEKLTEPVKLLEKIQLSRKDSESLPSVCSDSEIQNKNNIKIQQINNNFQNIKKSQFHHMESENFQSEKIKEKTSNDDDNININNINKIINKNINNGNDNNNNDDDDDDNLEYYTDRQIRKVKLDKQKKNIDRNFRFTHNTSKKIKSLGECHAELKLSGIMDGFKKKYMVLTHEKLYFFSNSQRVRVTNVVCFRAYQVKVQLLKNVIQLTLCQFNNKKWEIKFQNQELAENWCISIKEIIKKCYLYDGFGILKQFNKTYYNEDILTEIEFKRFCETGDVLLFETDNIGAVLQRKVTRSKYDHVGIVVRFSENDVRVFDANCDTGVTLMQWEQFIDENDLYTKVAIRRLIYSKKSEDAQPMLMNLMGETLGKKYGISVSKLLNVHKQYMTSQQNQQFIENFEKLDPKEKSKIQKMAQETALNTNKEEYFCSEITAIYYKRLGIMSPTIPSCQYWPVSFTQNRNLQLLKGAKFGNEISILLNRHRDPFNVSFE